MRRLALVAPLILAGGCAGSSPSKNADPSAGLSAVLVRGRLLLPTGETTSGRLVLNLESEAEQYRIDFKPRETLLYVVEPGVYHVYPARNFFGNPSEKFSAVINGRTYRVPFPRDILRLAPAVVKPRNVVPVGVLEVRLVPASGKSDYQIAVHFDNRVETRRQLVQDMITRMMDPDAPTSLRDNAVAWTQSLDQALVLLQGAEDVRPAYKPAE